MLSDLVDRVGCQTTGPRAIGGDFNYGPEELDQVSRLHALGFREVQDLRAWRHGVSAEPTGRGSKRIDQLWLSPELQRAYVDTRVEFDHWPDHAAVMTTFQMADMSEVITAWPRPAPFPWPDEWFALFSWTRRLTLPLSMPSFGRRLKHMRHVGHSSKEPQLPSGILEGHQFWHHGL